MSYQKRVRQEQLDASLNGPFSKPVMIHFDAEVRRMVIVFQGMIGTVFEGGSYVGVLEL